MSIIFIKTDQGLNKSTGTGLPTHVGLFGDEYTNTSNGSRYQYTTSWVQIAVTSSRVQSIVSASTVTATSDQDLIEVTAQSTGLEISNPTGPFTNGQLLEYKIKDNATPRTITLGTNVRNFTTFGLITTASKWTRLIVEYNAVDIKWDIIGFNTQP